MTRETTGRMTKEWRTRMTKGGVARRSPWSSVHSAFGFVLIRHWRRIVFPNFPHDATDRSINSDRTPAVQRLLRTQACNMVEEAPVEWAVWVETTTTWTAAARSSPVPSNPTDPHEAPPDEKLRKQREAEDRRRKQFVAVRTRWGSRASLPPVTSALAAISIVVALATNLAWNRARRRRGERAVIATLEPVRQRLAVDDSTRSTGAGVAPGHRLPSTSDRAPAGKHFWCRSRLEIETRRGCGFIRLLVLVTAVESTWRVYLPNPAHQSCWRDVGALPCAGRMG